MFSVTFSIDIGGLTDTQNAEIITRQLSGQYIALKVTGKRVLYEALVDSTGIIDLLREKLSSLNPIVCYVHKEDGLPHGYEYAEGNTVVVNEEPYEHNEGDYLKMIESDHPYQIHKFLGWGNKRFDVFR
jgi:hypothetical protein